MNDSENVELYPVKNAKVEFDTFFNSYSLDKVIRIPDKSITHTFKERVSRCCRFCGRSQPDTTFDSDAHIFPEFLGNKFLISDAECDDCNSKFSKYEDNLANWIGIYRTLSGVKGKKGVPKLKNTSIDVSWDEIEHAIEITSESMKYDPKNDEITFHYRSPGYTPIHVYKAFLKMALSVINDDDIKFYRPLVNFLLHDTNRVFFQNISKIISHQLPCKIDKPIGLLFKKNDAYAKIPSNFFYLYYFNNVYCFLIPFNEMDVKTGCYEEFNVILPPILFSNPSDFEDFKTELFDLSSLNIVKQIRKGTLNANNLSDEIKEKLKKNDANLNGFKFRPFG